jgi:hypothetical protein
MIDKHLYVDLLGGASGGACSCLIGHPFDTIKVRLQTQMMDRLNYCPNQTTKSNQFNQTINCVVSTIKNEGFFGLYRGFLPILMGVIPGFSLFFLGNATAREIQRNHSNQTLK